MSRFVNHVEYSYEPSMRWERNIGLQDALDIYREISRLVSKDIWQRQRKSVFLEISANSLLENFLIQANSIVLGLCMLQEAVEAKDSEKLLNAVWDSKGYSAVNCCGAVLRVINYMNREERGRFVSRFVDAIKNPDKFPGLMLEMRVALNFGQRGYLMKWPESGSDTSVDLIIPHEKGLHVECKAITRDKGKKIHRKKELVFLGAIKKRFKKDKLPIGDGLLRSVVVKCRKRLPDSGRDLMGLVDCVCKAYIAKSSLNFNDDFFIEYFEGNVKYFSCSEEEKDVISRGLGHIADSQHLEIAEGGEGVLISVQSLDEENFVEKIYRTLNDAAKRQLPKENPGLLIAQIESMTPEELVEVIEFDRSNGYGSYFFEVANRIISKPDMAHVIGINFFSGGVFVSSNEISKETGRMYSFWNKGSPWWSETFARMFDPITE